MVSMLLIEAWLIGRGAARRVAAAGARARGRPGRGGDLTRPSNVKTVASGSWRRTSTPCWRRRWRSSPGCPARSGGTRRCCPRRHCPGCRRKSPARRNANSLLIQGGSIALDLRGHGERGELVDVRREVDFHAGGLAGGDADRARLRIEAGIADLQPHGPDRDVAQRERTIHGR